MKYSVITVVRNGEASIAGTIKSVIQQVYTDFEYLIIDGASVDNTIEIIKSINFRGIKLISEPDGGIYDAMNKGIRYASGDYILFLNSGDYLYDENVLGHVSRYLYDNDLIYGDTILSNNNGKQYLQSKKFSSIQYGMPFCHQSVFVKASIMKNNYFATSYKYSSDYHLFYSLFRIGNIKYSKINFPISIYDSSGVSNSLISVLEQSDIASRQNPWSKSSFYMRSRYYYYYTTNFIKKVFNYKV
jgi:glycosyltransferase involved in cell wall biosynthesis